MISADTRAALGHQALGRSLTAPEQNLAAALETIFAAGQHDLAEAAQLLNQKGVARPSGDRAPWSLATLERELALINASLDQAYAQSGAMPA